jgi:hypothetical protein
MLPGFRFLFAAILLSISILVFGVGAAALLRATHEQFVANPSWRYGPQEQTFAQAPEPAPPVLAALRVEPVATDPASSLRDRIPTIAMPANDAMLRPEASAQLDTPAADASPTEAPAAEPVEMAAILAADSPAPAAVPLSGETTVAMPEEKTAAIDVAATAPNEPQPPAESAPAQAPSAADTGATRVAALDDPTATADTAAKTKEAMIGPELPAKRRAHRKRNRVARRPLPPPPVQQQAFYPFPLQAVQQPVTTTRPR